MTDQTPSTTPGFPPNDAHAPSGRPVAHPAVPSVPPPSAAPAPASAPPPEVQPLPQRSASPASEAETSTPQSPTALPQRSASPAPAPQGAPSVSPATSPQAPAARGPKKIATLPPLAELSDEAPPSPRTGEPKRPALVVVAMVALLVSAAAVAVTYGAHWWAAAHPATYPNSARLVEWVAPEPGKWLSLTLEGVLAIVAALVAGVSGAVGFHAWNGWRWTRWAGIVTVALHGIVAALFSWWGFIGVGLAVVGTGLLFLPGVTEFFRRFAAHRGQYSPGYRRPENVFYGRLPRYR